jgi:type IV secretion system protein VirD4
MLPQELKALGSERQVLLCEGLAHPVLCDKIRYHRDPYFIARLRPAVTIPALQG